MLPWLLIFFSPSLTVHRPVGAPVLQRLDEKERAVRCGRRQRQDSASVPKKLDKAATQRLSRTGGIASIDSRLHCSRPDPFSFIRLFPLPFVVVTILYRRFLLYCNYCWGFGFLWHRSARVSAGDRLIIFLFFFSFLSFFIFPSSVSVS